MPWFLHPLSSARRALHLPAAILPFPRSMLATTTTAKLLAFELLFFHFFIFPFSLSYS